MLVPGHALPQFTIVLCSSTKRSVVRNLNGALLVAGDLVPDDVPRAARLRLEADAVVNGVVDPVTPHPHVRAPVVRLDPIVRRVEDVVAEDVDVHVGIRDPVGDVRNPVVGDRVAARDVQVDALAERLSDDAAVSPRIVLSAMYQFAPAPCR